MIIDPGHVFLSFPSLFFLSFSLLREIKEREKIENDKKRENKIKRERKGGNKRKEREREKRDMFHDVP